MHLEPFKQKNDWYRVLIGSNEPRSSGTTYYSGTTDFFSPIIIKISELLVKVNNNDFSYTTAVFSECFKTELLRVDWLLMTMITITSQG